MTNEMREIKEAVLAGERALTSLKRAEEKLTSASNRGLWDIFGGGLISGIAKHSKMNEASSYMEEAKRNLMTFQKELRDVNGTYNLRLDIGGFLSFADFFFDGVIADYLVQTKIFEVNRTEIDGIMYDGILTCQYYDNGKFSDIRNNIIQLEVYKEFEICSEQTAFEQILDGTFVSGIDAGSKIEMGQVSLEYMLDTMHFPLHATAMQCVLSGYR